MSSPQSVQLGNVRATLEVKAPEHGGGVYVQLEAGGASMTIDLEELRVAVEALRQLAAAAAPAAP